MESTSVETPPRRFVADSDCERIHAGPITQPVNTITSLAYLAGGAVVWARAREMRRRSGAALPFAEPVAAALALNGVGSVAYHGPGGRWGKWLHDTGLVAMGATLAVAGFAREREWEHRRVHAADAALVAAAGAVLALRPGTELILAGPLAVVAIGQEVVHPSMHGRRRRLAGGLAIVVGAVVQARSRSGQPWCQPDGPFHGHGLWHLLSALGLTLVADAAVAEAAAARPIL